LDRGRGAPFLLLLLLLLLQLRLLLLLLRRWLLPTLRHTGCRGARGRDRGLGWFGVEAFFLELLDFRAHGH